MVPLISYTWQTTVENWANRFANPGVSNVFSLKSITFPEGGRTEYVYEGNTVSSVGVKPFFLSTPQETAVLTKSASVSAQGPDRHTFIGSSPNYTDGNGTSSFTYPFTISENLVQTTAANIYCSSNFGNTFYDLTENGSGALTCANSNVEFKLEKVVAYGNRLNIMDFKARDCSNNTFLGNHQETISLTPGDYVMTIVILYKLTSPTNINQLHSTSFNLSWKETNPNTPLAQPYVNIGGQRIKSMKSFSADNILSKHNEYSYLKPDNVNTSGQTISWPKHYQYVMKAGSGNDNTDYHDIKFYSNSITPLASTSGSFAGYEYVAEQTIGGTPSESLTTKYSFSFLQPYYDLNFTSTDEAILDAREWTRGKLLSTQYLRNGLPLKQIIYDYNSFSPHLYASNQEDYVDEINQDYISFQCGRLQVLSGIEDFYDFQGNDFDAAVGAGQLDPSAVSPFYYTVDDYNLANSIPIHLPYFKRYTGFDKPKSNKTITFDGIGNSISETENYYYEKTPLLNQLTKTQATNSKGDILSKEMLYPDDFAGVAPYDAMLQRHMLSPIIKESDYNNGNILSTTKANYHDWGNNIIAPLSTETTVKTLPTETRMQYLGYDSKGNLLEISKASGVHQIYLYGYHSQYPVAHILNSDYAAASALIGQATLDNDNGPVSDAAMRTELNKLRIGLPGAMVTTYTYAPLIGITSQTDPAGRTTYYEYDAMNRLYLVRDQDNNILKRYC